MRRCPRVSAQNVEKIGATEVMKMHHPSEFLAAIS
jgi:hypothetical protein